MQKTYLFVFRNHKRHLDLSLPGRERWKREEEGREGREGEREREEQVELLLSDRSLLLTETASLQEGGKWTSMGEGCGLLRSHSLMKGCKTAKKMSNKASTKANKRLIELVLTVATMDE